MAPGPVLGRFWPIGGYAARDELGSAEPGLAAQVPRGDQPVAHVRAGESERDPRPAARGQSRNVRLPIWSPLIDRDKLIQLAQLHEGVRRHLDAAEHDRSSCRASISGGKTLQGTVGERFILLRQDGKAVTRLTAGQYTFVVTDTSKTQNFVLAGPGREQAHEPSAAPAGATWTVTLQKGTYTFSSSARAGAARRRFRVT